MGECENCKSAWENTRIIDKARMKVDEELKAVQKQNKRYQTRAGEFEGLWQSRAFELARAREKAGQVEKLLEEIRDHFPPHLDCRTSTQEVLWLVKRVEDVQAWAEKGLKVLEEPEDYEATMKGIASGELVEQKKEDGV